MEYIESDTGLLTATKFKSFPVVNSTVYWISEGYLKLKSANFVTKCTCGIAESTLKNSMYLATPLVNKFKSQVNSLDSIAYNQLEKLETAFPIIKSDTENIVLQSKQLINKTVEPVSTQLETFKSSTKASVKNCFSSTSLTGQNLAIRLLDYSQTFLEQYIIYDLKNLEDDSESLSNYAKLNEKRCQDVIQRIKLLTVVFYSSLRNNLVDKAKLVLNIITVKYAKLYALLDWFNLYKTSLLNKTKEKIYLTKDKIDLYKEYLDVLSKQFTVQDGRSLHHVQSLEDRTKIIIRRSLGNLITAFHLVYSKVSNVIPIVQNRFKVMAQFVSDLYQIYNKHDGSLNEWLVDTILCELAEITHKTQSSMNLFIKKLSNSTVITWFVPNFETFGVLDYDFEEFAINKPQLNFENRMIAASSEEELANVFNSPECTYSSDFSHQNSGNSIRNNKSSCCDFTNIN